MDIVSQNRVNGGKPGVPISRFDGRVVGSLVDNSVHKTASASRHLLRVPPGWAADEMSIFQAQRGGAEEIVIHEKEFSLTFTASLAHFRERGRAINRGGAGAQLSLYLKHWNCAGQREDIEAFTRWLRAEGICSPNVCRDLRQQWLGEAGAQLSLFATTRGAG